MKELIAHARELAASETLVIGNDVRNTLANLAAAVERQQAEIGDLQSRVRLWTNRADELRLACDKWYGMVKNGTLKGGSNERN